MKGSRRSAIIITALAALTLTFALSTCGGKPAEAEPTPEPAPVEIAPVEEAVPDTAVVEEVVIEPEEVEEEPLFEPEPEEVEPVVEEEPVEEYIPPPPPKPAPPPTPVEPDSVILSPGEYARRLEMALIDLVGEGMLRFDNSDTMRIGVDHREVIRVYQQERVEELLRGLTADDGTPIRPRKSSVNVVIGVEGADFDIEELSPAQQPLLDARFSEWEYKLTPRKSGHQSLRVSTSIQVSVGRAIRSAVQLPTVDKPVFVQGNWRYGFKRFLKAAWLPLLLVVIAGGGLGYWYYRKQGAAPAEAAEPSEQAKE